jgi:hypothetical protein
VRPDAYLIVAAGRLLHASTLAELGEIAGVRDRRGRSDRVAARSDGERLAAA